MSRGAGDPAGEGGVGLRSRSTDPQGLPPVNPLVLAVAATTSVLLVAVSGRYGYHRDELYFLEAGRHLAWGYPDLPPLVPLVARVLSDLAPGSLVVLRLPSALAAGLVVLLTGLLAREFDGHGPAQLLAAVAVAASGLLLGSEHYLNTSGFDLLVWTLLLWLVVRLLRTGHQRLWLAIGVVTAVGLLNSDLVAFLMGAIVITIAIAGPRRLFASPWPWLALLIAAAAWAPYLLWQAHHGWPQLAVSRSIAHGSSGTSTPRLLLLPYQLALISPYLAPIWIGGLVRLLGRPALRWCRAVGWAYVLLAVIFLVSGGKSYYLAGMLPALLAAGAQPAIDWLHRGRTGVRRFLLAVALVLTVVGTVLVTLPVLPADVLHDTPVVALNYDEGETVGWPTYVGQIASVYRSLPPAQRSGTGILTSNYGEAGAVDRFGPRLGLPGAQSGQDGFWYWGPPRPGDHTFVVVGFSDRTLARLFGDCRLVTRLDNGLRLGDQEQGVPVRVCSELRVGWSEQWPGLRDLG